METENDRILEIIKEYLKSTRIPSAVYDKKLTLMWSNDDDFFEQYADLKHKLNASDIPLVKEKTFSVKSASLNVPFTLTPYYSGKKIIFYICTVYKSVNIIELMRKSEMQDAGRLFMRNQHSVIAHLISVSNAFEQSLDFASSEQKHDAVMKQISSATLMLTQLNTLNLLWEDDEYEEDRVSSISDLYTCIKEECNAELEKIGRRVEGTREYGNSYVAFSVKRMTVILMNLIQNALLYSPLKSVILFNLKFSSKKAIITVENEIADINRFLAPIPRSGMGIYLIKNAVSANGGSFDYSEAGGKATAELILPLVKTENSKSLNARQREYLQERFKPVHLYLSEIIQKEKTEL